jgi:hypothetical protein
MMLFASINNQMERFFRKNWNLLFSVFIGVSTICFGIYKNHSNTDATRDGALAFTISLLITLLFRLNNYQQLVEDSQDLVNKFIRLLTRRPQIAQTVEYAYKADEFNNEFYRFFLKKIFNDYNTHLQAISLGKYVCNAETELTLTKSILECCNKCLKAVSFQDESWWTSNEGILYLENHDKYIDKKNEKAVRIFIIESKSADSLKEIFRRHKELEIESYVLYTDTDHIDEKYKIDFVIYDDYMLRRASEVKNIDGGKDALFTTEEFQVQKYMDLFNQLLKLAKTKNHIIPV